jgi:hypothetical protein
MAVWFGPEQNIFSPALKSFGILPDRSFSLMQKVRKKSCGSWKKRLNAKSLQQHSGELKRDAGQELPF